MSFLSRVTSIARSVLNSPEARRAIRNVTRDVAGRATDKSRGASRGSSQGRHSAPRGPVGAGEQAIEYDIAAHGLPDFDYAPANDGDADPGEVCWTWVPYEDDPRQGKDRPVVILSRMGEDVVFAQMTSKDHAGSNDLRPDHLGRVWFNIGSGDWDSKGRESEVRIDRLLVAHKDSIRREGAVLDKTRFTRLAEAVIAQHR